MRGIEQPRDDEGDEPTEQEEQGAKQQEYAKVSGPAAELRELRKDLKGHHSARILKKSFAILTEEQNSETGKQSAEHH